mgnify:CR=1 FL=1
MGWFHAEDKSRRFLRGSCTFPIVSVISVPLIPVYRVIIARIRIFEKWSSAVPSETVYSKGSE